MAEESTTANTTGTTRRAVRPSPLRRSIVGMDDIKDPLNASMKRMSKILLLQDTNNDSNKPALLKAISTDNSTEQNTTANELDTPAIAGIRMSIYQRLQGGAINKAGVFSMTEDQKRLLRRIWEADFYATRLSSVLKYVPEIQHLLPIELGADDLYDKLKDGWILASFVNRIPGYYKYVDITKLTPYTPNPEFKENEKEGDVKRHKFLPLTPEAATKNVEQVLARIQNMPIRNTGVNVSHFEHAHKSQNRAVVLDLMRQLVKLETVEILSHSIVEICTIKAKKMKESGLKRFDALEAFRQSGRQATVSLNDGQDYDETLIRNFINESLQKGEFSERLADSMSLSEGLYNSIIYTQVLNYIDEACSLEALRMGDDIIGKAQTVLDNAKKIGVDTPFKSFHLAFGGDEIHFNFIASIAICAHMNEIRKLESMLASPSSRDSQVKPASTSRSSVKDIFPFSNADIEKLETPAAGDQTSSSQKQTLTRTSSSEAGAKKVKARVSPLEDIHEKETQIPEEKNPPKPKLMFWCSCG